MKKIFLKAFFFCLILESSVQSLVSKAYAQNGTFGSIDPPLNNQYFASGSEGQGLFLFLSNIFRFAGTIAGLYFVFQLISAGFMYLGASGDPKKIEMSTAKIVQSALGMVIVASAFVLAALITRFTGIEILNPSIYGPN